MPHPSPEDSRPARSAPLAKRRIARAILLWTTVATVLGLVVAGLRPRPLAVDLATVTTGPLTVSVLEEGKTRIRHRHVVSAPVSGLLQRISLRAGDRLVARETELAVIQPTPSSFLDPRSQAEAEARVHMAEATQRQRQAQLERARAALAMAEKELARTTQLQKTGAVSLREHDLAISQFDMLTRELHASEFALEVSRFEIQQAQAAARQAGGPNAPSPEADATAPIVLIAPVNGFVLNVFEESERPVTAGMPLVEVGDPADLEAEIELLSSDAVAVRPGAVVLIEHWGGDQPLRGKVTMIEPGGFTKISALGVEEQRVKVRVDFVDPVPPEQPLGDRYRVEARIVTWEGSQVVQVPAGALFRRGGDWMVFVYDDGKARLTKVQIGHHNGEAAELIKGVSPGQRLILHPPDTLADGKPVKPRS